MDYYGVFLPKVRKTEMAHPSLSRNLSLKIEASPADADNKLVKTLVQITPETTLFSKNNFFCVLIIKKYL